MGRYGPVNDPQHTPHQLRAAGEQETQLKWKAQHPLANGLFRQNLIDQLCGTFGHASRTTTGAESAPLATERDQVFTMAFFTLHPQEPVFQTSAFEVIGKFLLHMQGQGLALHGHHIPELRVMPFDDLIEKSLFRSMPFIG
jgi:hypothetical protein